MTDPSQYFKGRTVQEQMNEVIGYVDVRAEEVADAKAQAVLQPAEDAKDAAIQAKDDAQAAQAAAEQAVIDAAAVLINAVKKTGESSQSIAGDIAISGALTVIGLIAAQAGVNVPLEATGTYSTKAANSNKVRNEINNLAVMLTGSQTKSGMLTMTSVDPIRVKQSNVSWAGPTATFYLDRLIYGVDMDDRKTVELYATHDASGQNNAQLVCTAYADDGNGDYTVSKRALINLQVRSSDGKCRLILQTPSGQNITIQDWVA